MGECSDATEKHLRRTREQPERPVVHPHQEAAGNPIGNMPATAPQSNAATLPVVEQPVSKSTPAKETPKKPGPDDQQKERKQDTSTPMTRTRSGRVIKAPSRFKD
ncbi:hypothetical protein OS493_019836 [Desmophyllum pertusum]|uniref:Uncharacterized protein n=1 Tax=Desmophyllum pertusum TaxID=174260 RepID=A0A9X0CR43_9CNID|nr:hypothetical protein OS493_019836 [Desmophyllum pertusum]